MLSRVDEELLGAYVDGELGDEDARRVEAAIADDHRLAEAVRDLRAVRELIAELPRTPSPDVSAAVLQALRGRTAGRRWWRNRSAAAWVAGGLAASAAAALLLAAVLRHGPAPRTPLTRPIHAEAEVGGVLSGGPLETAASVSAAPTAKVVSSVQPGNDRPRMATAPEFPLDRERLRSLMGDMSLRRVFLITDRIGGEAESRVESLVERSSPRDFFKITISQGIVIDPLHPGEAVVFAVVVDETELDPLRRGLESEFGESMMDGDVIPSVALHLAEVGQVVSLPPSGAGVVSVPSDSMALRTPADQQPTPEQERSSPAADRRKAGGVASPLLPVADGPPLHDHPTIVLVWIERPGAG